MIIRLYDRFDIFNTVPVPLKTYVNVYDVKKTATKMTDIDYFKLSPVQLNFSLIDEDNWLYDNIVLGVKNVNSMISLIVRVSFDSAPDEVEFTGYIKQFGNYDFETKRINLISFDFTQLINQVESRNLTLGIVGDGDQRISDSEWKYKHYDIENFDAGNIQNLLIFLVRMAGYRYFNYEEIFTSWLHRVDLTNGDGGAVDAGDGTDVITGEPIIDINEDNGKCFEIQSTFQPGLSASVVDSLIGDTNHGNFHRVQAWPSIFDEEKETVAGSLGIYPYFDEDGLNPDKKRPVVISIQYHSRDSAFADARATYRVAIFRMNNTTLSILPGVDKVNKDSNSESTDKKYNQDIQPILDRFHIRSKYKQRPGIDYTSATFAPFLKRNDQEYHLMNDLGYTAEEVQTDYRTIPSYVSPTTDEDPDAHIGNIYYYYIIDENGIEKFWTIDNYETLLTVGDGGNIFQFDNFTSYVPYVGGDDSWRKEEGAYTGDWKILYTGTLLYSTVLYKDGEHSVKNLLQLHTLMSDMTIYSTKLGIIRMIDKYSIDIGTPILIDNNDIIDPKLGSIPRREVSFTLLNELSIDSDERQSDVHSITAGIETYYEDNFNNVNRVLKCKISYLFNSYDLDIDYIITVLGSDYKIISINNNDKEKNYTIEAWNHYIVQNNNILLEDGQFLFTEKLIAIELD